MCADWTGNSVATRQEEREILLRLLPRLPVLFMVQDLVNGLVSGAPDALSRQGRQATLVQWNWLRDDRHHFSSQGTVEETHTMRVDGRLSFCVRFAGSEPEWLTFWLLYCPVDEPRLLRTRLDRILRWREARPDQPMPTLLILATAARQAEWWHLACAQVVDRLHVDLPVGAVTWSEQQIGQSWRLPWHTLGTHVSCQLQELVQTHTSPPFPEREAVWGKPLMSQEADPVWEGMLPSGERAFALNTVAARSHLRRIPEYRLACLTLTARQWEILKLCFTHPLLSRDNLAAVLSLHPTSVSLLLVGLERAGYLACSETVADWRWQMTEAGLRLIAHLATCSISRFVRTSVDQSPLQQRGVAGLRHQIRHTAGLYGFVADLAQALRSLPDARLRWWETGARCEQVFSSQQTTYHFKPDALLCARVRGNDVRFWLEWDRGTMGVRDLERKCATYAAYLASREWARGGASPPGLVCVVPELAQEHRFLRTATALLAHTGLRLAITTAGLLTQGILAPIWQQFAFPVQTEPRPRTWLFPET